MQIADSTIRLVRSPRYYPLHFHCVEVILEVAEASRKYVPVAQHLLDLLDHASLHKKSTKQSKSPMRKALAVLIRVKKDDLATRECKDLFVERAFALLRRFFALYEFSIGPSKVPQNTPAH